MSWWKKILSHEGESLRPQRLDYLNEGLALERSGDYEAAVTSYRLALRDRPGDVRVHQYIAMALSRTGRPEEAVRHYRRAIELDPDLAGAHYGLAFLLLKRGEKTQATEHLQRFLARPTNDPEMDRWVQHARSTLEALESEEPKPVNQEQHSGSPEDPR